jgi:alkaline phosphatase D
MASLRAPGLGPIVGHTTDTTCRIWIRAADVADKKLEEDRRTIGVIGIVGGGKNPEITDAWYFRMQREFDRTGAYTLGEDRQLGWYPSDFKDEGKKEPANLKKGIVSPPLDPDTEYTVRLGTLTLDDPLKETETMPDWKLRDRLPNIDAIKQELLDLDPDSSEAVFRTFPKSGQIASKMAFILGSCRYPGLPGLFGKDKEADRIFGPIQKHFVAVKQQETARYTIMTGDQIYADMLNKAIPLLRADTYEEFQERYVSAFSSFNLRKLMRSSTTYMILDDHEIEDNWSQDRVRGSHQLFNFAISSYMSYQWSHSPRTWGRLLFYTFECAGYPTFVLDTRTQRYKDDQVGLRDNHLLGRPSLDPDNHPGQLLRLCNWLSEQQKNVGDAPKFIVSGSVFAPNPMDERVDAVSGDATVTTPGDEIYLANAKRRDGSDSWPAFPNTRRDLLRHIVKNKIQNVVFLGGDIHCSCLAELEFDGNDAKGLKAFSLTSSAFYWPFPFADGDPNGYVHDSRAKEQSDPFPIGDTDAVMHYRAFGFTQEDNFSRIDIDRAKGTITVRIFNRRGEPVEVANAKGKLTAANVLQLAKW